MKTFEIKTPDRVLKLRTPSNWEEVTIEQYTRMESFKWDGKDSLQLLSILSGANLSELDNITDPKLYESINEGLAFIAQEPPDFERLKKKHTYTIGGRECKVPKDLELQRIGQKIMMTSLLGSDDLIEQIPMALAIYFQPIYDGGKFDRDRLPAIIDKVKQTPIVEAYPVVRFFFLKLKESKLNGRGF